MHPVKLGESANLPYLETEGNHHMSTQAAVEPIPLHTDTDGVIRVAGTRITLDTIIGAYLKGETPEQIAQDYSAVDLASIYAVITYYLRHREEVEAYLEKRHSAAEAVRRKFKGLFPTDGLRERLLSRLQPPRYPDASPSRG